MNRVRCFNSSKSGEIVSVMIDALKVAHLSSSSFFCRISHLTYLSCSSFITEIKIFDRVLDRGYAPEISMRRFLGIILGNVITLCL